MNEEVKTPSPTPQPAVTQVVSSLPSQGKKFFQNLKINKKIIFLMLILVVLFESALAFRTLTQPSQKQVATQSTQGKQSLIPLSGGKIVLQTSRKNYPIDGLIPINIKVFTGGHQTEGTDVLIKFDPKMLSASESGFFKGGNIYSEFPQQTVDSKNGLIRVSGITSNDDKGFNGVGTLGVLNLKALKSGKTSLKVEFKKGSTTDSNVIDSTSAKDILDGVYDLELVIGQPVKVDTPKSQKCDSFIQSCIDLNGKKGQQKCSEGILKDNVCSFDPQLTSNCGACSAP